MANFLKLTIIFFITILISIILSFTSWQLWQKYQYKQRQKENAIQKNIEINLANQIQNDNWGGNSPEETLTMFIAAVEKNNLNAASRYFIIPAQSENLKILQANQANGKNAALLKIWKKFLQNKELINFSNEEFFNDSDFDYTNQQNIYNNKEFVLADDLESDNPPIAIFRLYPRRVWKIRAISLDF